MSSSKHNSHSPTQRYEADLASGEFSPDDAQKQAVELLQDLYLRLIERNIAQQEREGKLGERLKKMLGKRRDTAPEKGLYFWGGVGRGKTYLMDTFYEALPFNNKLRVHFHRFMRRVHADLTRLEGEKNPLDKVAEELAAEVCVICFDEFFVSDITDAMLLAGLFEGLFARGVCLVATSNIEPDGLYKDGLQRARFLPAIALLNKHTNVVNIDGGVDYRLRALEQARLYYSPIDSSTEASLEACFHHLAPVGVEEFVCISSNVPIEIEGRELHARHLADDVVWFEFLELCDGPRSQMDYIELAREFHAVIISNVPQMDSHADDKARRFILMVDEFYDRKIKLVISADVAVEQLYIGSRLAFEFERTVSRLLEMQSHDYLASAHRA